MSETLIARTTLTKTKTGLGFTIIQNKRTIPRFSGVLKNGTNILEIAPGLKLSKQSYEMMAWKLSQTQIKTETAFKSGSKLFKLKIVRIILFLDPLEPYSFKSVYGSDLTNT